MNRGAAQNRSAICQRSPRTHISISLFSSGFPRKSNLVSAHGLKNEVYVIAQRLDFG
jgi:hypothetical protein